MRNPLKTYLSVFDYIATHSVFYKYEVYKSGCASYNFLCKLMDRLEERGYLSSEEKLKNSRRITFYKKTDKFKELMGASELNNLLINGGKK